jgi:hypothetical protein
MSMDERQAIRVGFEPAGVQNRERLRPDQVNAVMK